MGAVFNVEEIFKIAEQIERNGAAFYKKASENSGDAEQKRKLTGLATMEEEHELVFAAMREELSKRESESTAFDPQGEAEMYLNAFADGHIFDINADPSELLTGQESLEDVLKIAIDLEKDSVVFYVGIKEVVPESLGKDKVEKVIQEEMGHITLLSKELATLT